MSLKFGKRDVSKMADVLDQDYESVEEAAAAALEAAMQIIETKAKFTVVGQIKQRDNKGDKVALGWYSTEKQALDDALKLAYSTVTHEEGRAWVLPLHHQTPHAWFMARKNKLKIEAADDAPYREQELARRTRWIEEHPGEKLPDDWTVEVAMQQDTDECTYCHGIGRVPKAHLPRRSDLPDNQKFY